MITGFRGLPVSGVFSPEPMPDSEITGLLARASRGESEAIDRLFEAVYARLRLLARRHLQGERTDHTLGATALVHEAFLKLAPTRATSWEDQAHFFRIASQAMRRILVDHARRRRAGKRQRALDVSLPTQTPAPPSSPEEILAINDGLTRLAEVDPRAARLVELRFFGGMSNEESARILEISPVTAKRDWIFARGWLQRTLE